MEGGQTFASDLGKSRFDDLVEVCCKNDPGLSHFHQSRQHSMPYIQRNFFISKSLMDILLLRFVVIAKGQIKVEGVFFLTPEGWEAFTIHVCLDLTLNGFVIDIVGLQVLIFMQAVKF